MLKRGLLISGGILILVFFLNSIDQKNITGRQISKLPTDITGISCTSPMRVTELNQNPINVINRLSTLSPESFEAVKKQVLTDIGIEPKKYFGYIDEVSEIRLIKALLQASNQASNNPHGITISPELLFTFAMMEGLDLWIEKNYYSNPNAKLSGFHYLGLNYFSNDVITLKNLGFLRPDYAGFKKQRVTSAIFDNIDLALEAMAAEIAYHQYLFLEYARELGHNPNDFSEDEKIFWTYIYFNPGPTFAKRNLRQNKNYCCSNNICCYWSGKQLPYPASIRNAKYLSLQKVATYEWVKRMEVFA